MYDCWSFTPWFFNVTCWVLFYSYYSGRCSFEQVELNPDPRSSGRSTRYSKILHNYSVIIPRCYNDFCFNSCFPGTAIPWNSLPPQCSCLMYDLNGLKFIVNRQFFFLRYFRNSFHIGFLTFDSSSPCNSMLFSEYPPLHWVNPSNFNVFVHITLEVQLKVVTKAFLNAQENMKWIKRLKIDRQIFVFKDLRLFLPYPSRKRKKQKNNFP